MSSPEKKRKKPSLTQSTVLTPTPPPQSIPIVSLPDDLLVSCFARVSRLYYPTLSLVSNSFGSLLASPELYKTRSSIGHTESSLYVCLRFHPDSNPSWFTLCRKPEQIPTSDATKKKKKKSSGYALAKIPTPHSPPVNSSGLVTIGSDIYNISGSIGNAPSSSVSIMDCRTHTWREGPSTLVKRTNPHAVILDGKIYVAGYGTDPDYSDWMEVFDPKTQTWELVSSSPDPVLCVCDNVRKSAAIGGKVYMVGNLGLTYDPRSCKWGMVGCRMDLRWVRYSYCVIEDVLYHYDGGRFEWYDSNAYRWNQVNGVKGLPKITRSVARLADYGGKMVVLWDKFVTSGGDKNKVIWCAVIALERRKNGEIWGEVEWDDAVLTVPKSCKVQYALAATV
ncbi:unnamed protein product [Microthlaspi erraticum]|uniref:Uncharacterized protein n=1 Tax=Microthlaspi erraticum TaxID=1685480 RepID=A0A6D2I5U6_9BRAS|nr:unnamed protein product [Microthlaspi erraticum]